MNPIVKNASFVREPPVQFIALDNHQACASANSHEEQHAHGKGYIAAKGDEELDKNVL